MLSLPITEGSAKVRTGPPGDDEPDYALDTWAGVIPITDHRAASRSRTRCSERASPHPIT